MGYSPRGPKELARLKEQQIVPPGEFYDPEGDRRATHICTYKTVSQAFLSPVCSPENLCAENILVSH